ncbi:endonuclease III domain-containing protein [Pedobacter steynii]
MPEETIHVAHHWLILHGRYICVARSPKCSICEITSFCKYYQNTNKITKIFSDSEPSIKK